MKIDHFVINVDSKYQKDKEIIRKIRESGFPYEPKWGKGTKGFKASNLWIGNEYFEMIHIMKEDGGGWIKDWTKMYNQGQRGLICLMLDVPDIEQLYNIVHDKNIKVTKPEWLEFRWFMNLLTRRMPWKNSYIPFFDKVPLQIGFQQMKDEKAREFMNQYMVPNSRDNGIEGIKHVIIKGDFTEQDFTIIGSIFNEKTKKENKKITIELDDEQRIDFIKYSNYEVEIYTKSNEGRYITIENIKLFY